MLSEQAQTVLSVLQTAHIEYHVKEHIPVYTIDEMSALHLPRRRGRSQKPVYPRR